MGDFHWDPVEEVVNKNLLGVVDAGPLHAPIKSFVLRRDEALEMVLETEIAEDAALHAQEHPPGTLRINDDALRMANDFGLTVVAKGVQPRSFGRSGDYVRRTSTAIETSTVHTIEATFPAAKAAAYTIDWLENVDDRRFLWPHHIQRETVTSETRLIGPASLRVVDSQATKGGARSSVALQVGGCELYLCAKWIKRDERRSKSGCLIYMGTPDEETLKRIRNVLSFSLGMYLVPLGHTVYAEDWDIVSFKSVSPYSIDGRAFDLPVMPPAPLSQRSREIEPDRLSRMANALYSAYDELDFDNLNWGFWHARCATPHIAAVHFRAIIEALRNVCLARYSAELPTKLIEDGAAWNAFSAEIFAAIAKLKIPEDNKALLREAAGRTNGVPHQVVTAAILSRMKLEFGADERAAWKRRNDAAHGRGIKPGTELEVIRDTKRLRGLFDRMLLSLSDASDAYYDYSSLNFPIRRLEQAPPPTNPS